MSPSLVYGTSFGAKHNGGPNPLIPTMKRMIVILTVAPHHNDPYIRRDTFWCSTKCDGCVLRFRCFTEPEKDAFELDLDDFRGSGLELGEEIG